MLNIKLAFKGLMLHYLFIYLFIYLFFAGNKTIAEISKCDVPLIKAVY